MEEDKDFKNIWKVYRLYPSETERVRSNTFPGSLSLNEQSFEYDTSDDSQTLIKPYSNELYGSKEELSERFQDKMRKVKNDCPSPWILPHYNHGIENLNWSMQCNEGSFTRNTTPMKDQLEIEAESMSQSDTAHEPEETATNKFVIFSKKTSLRPKLKIKSEKQQPEKRHSLNFVNEDNMTPTKKCKDYDDISNNLRPITLRNLSAISVADNFDKRENPQCKHLLKAKKNFTLYECFKFVLLIIFLTFISVIMYENLGTHKHSTDFANAVVELKKHVYGHYDLQRLCEYLESDVPFFKVIVLFGDTGVGKSYTANIIRENFSRKYAIRYYFPPLKKAMKDIDIPFLYPNLIILENLKYYDMMDVVNFLKARQDIYNNRVMTVLAIFNFENRFDYTLQRKNQPNDSAIIQKAFFNKNVGVKIFFYEPLNENALRKCIIDAMKKSKLMLNETQFDFVKKRLLSNGAGCKRANTYIQRIGRM
ncbi:PREDICTED: uncharacterized protein LOC108782036 [Cyphomyrmex costatus]|uniref:uncharacterized protein LOC108782036 n=1 Tax=Cyphomyrmex costatus TaxID=456900 RepID=UPI0008523BED|nr:PREDICTED: uncharacterized protein LOC108782036 [Cyphomyrmex costatus]